MIFFIITLLPLVIFCIFKDLLGKSWALIILLFWFLFRFLKHLGFSFLLYKELSIRGFAEPLSNLLFLSSVAMIIKIFQTKNFNLVNENSYLFFLGILLKFFFRLGSKYTSCFFSSSIFYFFFLLYKKKYKVIILLWNRTNSLFNYAYS